MPTIELMLPDDEATRRAGAALATAVVPGTVITLSGELGAGKTTLARALLRALGVAGPVKSPTYALVELYEVSNLYLYHFDFYRFDNPADFDDAGLREYFRPDAVCLVEWPERAGTMLPPADLALDLAFEGEGRRLTARAAGARGESCLSALAAAGLPRP